MDWFSYLEFAIPFLPWKPLAKSLLFHTASLSLGLAAFFTSTTLNRSRRKAEGVTTMTRMEEKKPQLTDYLIAHPLLTPLWVWLLLYSFLAIIPSGFLAGIPLIFFLWLKLYSEPLIRILEYQPQERKEALPCTELAKI